MSPPIQSRVLEDWIDRGLFKELSIRKRFEKLVFELDSAVLRSNRFGQKLDLNIVISRTIWVSMDSEFAGEQIWGGV